MAGAGLNPINDQFRSANGFSSDYGKIPYPHPQNQAEVDANMAALKKTTDPTSLSNQDLQASLDMNTKNRDTAETALAGGGTLKLGPTTTEGFNQGSVDSANATIQALQNELTKRTGLPGPASLGSTPSLNTAQPTLGTGSNSLPPGSLPSAPVTATSPAGGIVGGNTPTARDEASLLAEAELQKQLAEQTQTGIASSRSQNLSDLANLITQQQQHLISQDMPGLYEDLNTRGLLRSSELGNAIGREQAKAATNLQDVIGQQGISDREANLSAMSGIENNYLGGRSSAIQRGMSLQDFQRSLDASKALGFALQPQQPSGGKTGAQTAAGGIGLANSGIGLAKAVGTGK